MAAIIWGLVLLVLVVLTLAYAAVRITKGKDLPHHYFTIPLAVIVGMFAMSVLRSL
jgi:carbon starvation protein CstA